MHRKLLYLAILSMTLVMSCAFENSNPISPTGSAAIDDSLGTSCNLATLTADFVLRDALPQSDTPQSQWYIKNWNNGWGPKAATYPTVEVPTGCDGVAWKQARVIAVARKYLGLRYQHHHIPAWNPPVGLTEHADESPGLDCSNFTAWVYNYGLGIRFTSDVQDQGESSQAPGRRLAPSEPFAPGDLLFILKQDSSAVSHVVIYIDAQHIIDSSGNNGVTEHGRTGWYKTHFAYARRIIE